ncbi:HEPN domain-containing protein [Burkholderia ubonensis]|uniref:HEPN domain-containing protein n=1 Tax=Burkholderia ubonensis TaxID=101571 RepID=UPI000AE77D0B|nr:HEPN domain-containing protein [Burkholderia ubonensis]
MPFHPITAANACIRRSRRLLTLAQHPLPDGQVKNDLRRSALVMAVTAVDSYMHWLVYRRISEVRKEGDLPKSLAKLDLPFTEMAALADATVRGRKIGKDTRPWVQVKNVMQKRLLKETFQSYEQVAIAFSWAGIEKPWSRVAAKLIIQADDIKSRLNSLVHRRNQIVHEGDIARSSRPQTLKYNAVAHAEVVADVDWIESLIAAIEQVVADGNPP